MSFGPFGGCAPYASGCGPVGPVGCGYGGYGGGSNYGKCRAGYSNCANCLNQANSNLCLVNQSGCFDRNYVYVQANERGYNSNYANRASNCLAARQGISGHGSNLNGYGAVYPYGGYAGC